MPQHDFGLLRMGQMSDGFALHSLNLSGGNVVDSLHHNALNQFVFAVNDYVGSWIHTILLSSKCY